jgi:hypothetical protein
MRNAVDASTITAMLKSDKPRLHDQFELRPTLHNFTAEFLCKVQTWQNVRDYAVNVQKSYGATIGALVLLLIIRLIRGGGGWREGAGDRNLRADLFGQSETAPGCL